MFYLYLTLISIAWFSLVEWALHRFIMHKNLKWFPYPFKAHANVHHRMFKADDSYLAHTHENPEKDAWKIPMAWWNGIVLVAIGSAPAYIASAIYSNIWISFLCLVVGAAYYGTYERLHWCMHLPKERRLEMSPIFRRLNGHHLLHHRFMHKNFNVVLPLWDLVFGTLLLRSPISFKQATGPSVPDVQPKIVLAD